MPRSDVLESLDALGGMAGEAARQSVEETPLPYETPGMTQGRVAQQDSQRRAYGRIKAQDLENRGVAYTTTPRGETREVTDSTGAPLTNADKANRIAYDSAGKPVDYSQRDTNGQPVVRDAYEGVPEVTDPSTGNKYQIRKGLPWNYTGQDAAVAGQVQEQNVAKINERTSRALSQPEADAKARAHEANKAMDASTEAMKVKLSMAGLPSFDPNGGTLDEVRNQVEGIYNGPDKYGSPLANRKPWFGGGKFSPEAEAERKKLDVEKQDLMDSLAAHHDVLKQASAANGEANAISDVRKQLRGDKLAEINKQRVAAGLEPVLTGKQPAVAAAEPGVTEQPADEQSADGIPATVKDAEKQTPASLTAPANDEQAHGVALQNLTAAKNGAKAYLSDGVKTVEFKPEAPYDGLKQAAKDGVIDLQWAKDHESKFKLAQEKYEQLVESAGGYAEAKALLHGGGLGAAFLAGSIPGARGGAALGALIPGLGETGISEVVGGAIGGLATGTLAAFAARKGLEALGEYTDAVKSLNDSAELHPHYDEAGQLLAFGASAPKAISNLVRLGQVAGGGAAAAKAIGLKVAGGAAGGLAFEAGLRPAFDAVTNAAETTLGIDHEDVQSPTVKSLVTNAALGALLAGHDIRFKDVTVNEAASVMYRDKVREMAGVAPDTKMGVDEVVETMKKAGVDLSPDQAQSMTEPLSEAEQHFASVTKDKLQAMADAGVKGVQFEGGDQALSGRGKPLASKVDISGRGGEGEVSPEGQPVEPQVPQVDGQPQTSGGSEPRLVPSSPTAQESAPQPSSESQTPAVAEQSSPPRAETIPQTATSKEASSEVGSSPEATNALAAEQQKLSDATALMDIAKREGNAMAVALHGKEVAEAQARIEQLSKTDEPLPPQTGAAGETGAEGQQAPAVVERAAESQPAASTSNTEPAERTKAQTPRTQPKEAPQTPEVKGSSPEPAAQLAVEQEPSEAPAARAPTATRPVSPAVKETREPAPAPPKESAPATQQPKSPAHALETVKSDIGKALKIPMNVTTIAATDSRGKVQYLQKKNGDFKGANPFAGEKWSKVQGGNLTSKGVFQPSGKIELAERPAEATVSANGLPDSKDQGGAAKAGEGVAEQSPITVSRANSAAVREHRDEPGGTELGKLGGAGETSFTSLAKRTKPSEAKAIALLYARDNKAMLNALGVERIEFTDKPSSGSGAAFDTKKHQIEISPARVAELMDWVRDNNQKPGDGKALLLAWLDHEVIHAAQNTVAKQAGKQLDELYTDGWKDSDLPDDLRKAAREFYGPEWDDKPEWQKRAEAVRMVIENRWKGKITEQIYKAIEALKNFFKELLGLHPESEMLKRQVRATEEILRNAGAEFKEEPLPAEPVAKVEKKESAPTKEQAPPEEKPATVADIRAEIEKLKADGDPEKLVPGLEKVAKLCEPKNTKVETPAEAVKDVSAQIEKAAEGQTLRTPKEIKAELVKRLKKAIAKAPELTAEQADILKNVSYGRDRQQVYDATDADGRKAGMKKLEVSIPDDGTFKIWNTKEVLADVLKRVEKMPTTLKDYGPPLLGGSSGKNDAQILAEHTREQLGGRDEAIDWLRENSKGATPGEQKVNESAIEILKKEALGAAEPSRRETVDLDRAQEIVDNFDKDDPETWPADLGKGVEKPDENDRATWTGLLSPEDRAAMAKEIADKPNGFDVSPYFDKADQEFTRLANKARVRANDLERQMRDRKFLYAADPEKSGPFYSQLTRTVQALPQQTMTVEQARAAITKGAKPDEIKMSGILDDPLSPIAGKPAGSKVTKSELESYAVERQTRVKDVTLGDNASPISENLKAYIDREAGYNLPENPEEWTALSERLEKKAKRVQKSGDQQQANGYFDLSEEASRRAEGLNSETGSTAGETHFSQYQLPGAELGSYREQFVTWPQKRKWLDGSSVTDEDVSTQHGKEAADRMASPQDGEPDWNDGHAQYDSITNPIVRIRRNIRADANGRKTFFIEEMQGPSKIEQHKMPPEVRKRIYEIGMKRAIRDAVDSGADAIGWTNGDQQAERYDLSKQVEEVKAFRREDGTFDFMVKPVGETSYKDIDAVPESKLEDHIGKELAAKVSAQPDGWQKYSGVDLKVGGTGLRNLYDKVLPAIANKLAEKAGGKVGTAKIPDEESFDTESYQDFLTRNGLKGSQENNERYMRERQNVPKGTLDIHSMALPEKWKQEAPSFSLYAATPDKPTPEGAATPEGQTPSGSQPSLPSSGEPSETNAAEELPRNEKLMQEAEAAGLRPSLETIKGAIKNDPAALDKLRKMIADKTGKDALNAATLGAEKPTGKYRLSQLPRDMREQLFNEWAVFVNPEGTEREFYAKSVPTGWLNLEGVQISPRIKGDQLNGYRDTSMGDYPPVVIADGKLTDGQHRIALARERGIKRLRYIDVSGLTNTDPIEGAGHVSELPKEGQQSTALGAATPHHSEDQTRDEEGKFAAMKIPARMKAAVTSLGEHLRGVSPSPAIRDLNFFNAVDEATQHVGARSYVPLMVQDFMHEIFGPYVKDEKFIAKVGEAIRDDNILGGYDGLKKDAAALSQKADRTVAETRELGGLRNRISEIEKTQDLGALDKKVQAATKDPAVKGAIDQYSKVVTPEMDTLYNEMKGLDPETPRETRGRHFEARVNLLSKAAEERMKDFADPDKPMPEMSASSYRNPDVKRDQFDRRASYTGEYSGDLRNMLTNSFAGRVNEVTKQRLYTALEKSGKARLLEPGEHSPQELGGEPTSILQVKRPKTINGKTQQVAQRMAVPTSKVETLRRVLNTDLATKQNPILRALTKLQIIGIADATAHTKNQISTVTNTLGRDANWKAVLSRIPVLGSLQSVAEIRGIAKDVAKGGPEITKEMAELAKSGMLRSQGPKSEGWQKWLPGNFLHENDVAARVFLSRAYDRLVKDPNFKAEDTVAAKRAFVMQVGEYNRRLMGAMESALRDYGASPFIVAGKTFNRFGKRMVFGEPGFNSRDAKASARARAAMLTPLLFGLGTVILGNMLLNGTLFGRKGTPVGAIDLGPEHDDKKGTRKMLDLFQLSGIRRGLRAIGADALVNGLQKGDTLNEITGKMFSDAFSTNLHPYIGPGAGALFETATGKRLDLRQGWQRSFEARKYDGGQQYLENARAALKHLNALGYEIAKPVIGKVMGAADMSLPAEGKPFPSGVVEAAAKAPLSAVGYKEGRSPALELAGKLNADRMPVAPMDEQQQTKRIEKSGLLDAIRSGDNSGVSKALTSGTIKPQDLQKIVTQASQPPLVSALHSMPLEMAEQVFQKATPEEKRQLIPLMVQKRLNAARAAARQPVRQPYIFK